MNDYPEAPFFARLIFAAIISLIIIAGATLFVGAAWWVIQTVWEIF